ncbi:enoyl-CoA hydratase-related protein [Elizabethkingia sp. JS20170427COW]|uniref:enoyl-CoA hydratase-related protein n=1 Tax=Elizabethkingia sp. JS20170427COW TaxID=2583851 RepID=UPI001110BCA9|nr:enoyl-CoA hydratase-related protein [Elizabethkingia sp. JS20170427COW]QCX52523.1 enoyl-CoA hydratase [Elizabethkingia sp. JS20170427COW]
MNYTQFDIENKLDGSLKIVYLNQPESFNALNRQMLKELTLLMKECNDDPTVRCIALSARGEAFCAGQNLKEAFHITKEIEDDRIVQRMVIDYYNPLVTAIVKNKKPVISLVNGAAVGAGAMLALICDFTLAKKSAYFSQAFVNIGLIPDTAGTYFLPKLLGRQLANYLAFTGKKLSATEAWQKGLIAEVFEDEDFETKSMEILIHLAQQPTKAISLTKKAFNLSYVNSLTEQLDVEGIYQQRAAETLDFQEGVAAFLEKRKPNYQGK